MTMTIIVGSGNKRSTYVMPDRKDRSIAAQRDREDLKNFIARPKLFAATR